jgi:hypothetical protein
MGGVILIFLLGMAIVILLTPALQARGRKRRDEVARSAHEAVVSRLEDHRRKKSQPADDKAER